MSDETRRPKVVVYEGSQQWSAVYVDGKRVQIGDHYLADEKVREIFGVTTVQSDDFLRGGNGVGIPAPAQTLAEIDAYRTAREEREQEAARLRAEAERLNEQAAAEETDQP